VEKTSLSKPKIFIATPTVGNVFTDYVHSLVATVQQLHRQGVETEYATFDGSASIADKRDWLAHRFLKSDATHLLFIDADMAFDATLASTLLARGKDVIGAICTTRRLDLAAYAAAAAKGNPNALALAHEFHYLADENRQIQVAGDLARVAGLGTGFLLVSRRCVETLAASVPRYRAHDGDMVAGLFARIPRGDERPWGEDLSFCRRWREAGGEVFGYIKAQIWHCGTMRYGVPFEQHLAAVYGHPVGPPKAKSQGQVPRPSPKAKS
jgi:hypothetical protein